jgi:hypothetical protein
MQHSASGAGQRSTDRRRSSTSKERILAMLSERGLDVRSLQAESPDLVGAYFQLTGVAVEQGRSTRPGLLVKRASHREMS